MSYRHMIKNVEVGVKNSTAVFCNYSDVKFSTVSSLEDKSGKFLTVVFIIRN